MAVSSRSRQCSDLRRIPLVAKWDVFHSDRLELERELTSEAIRSALVSGTIQDDDLVRPAGTTAPWTRLGDLPEMLTPSTPPLGAPAEPLPGEPGRQTTRREPVPARQSEDFEEVQP